MPVVGGYVAGMRPSALAEFPAREKEQVGTMRRRVVIVTGASRGIGRSVALSAARLGADVALFARSARDLGQLADEIRSLGGMALAIEGDVGAVQDCKRAVTLTLESFRYLDAIVNNAGTIRPIAPIADADAAAWLANWRVNVLGPVQLSQAAIPHLRASHGRVVNISSGAAEKTFAGWAAYSVSKAGLEHFTRMLAAEEIAITAVSLRPGAVRTAMQDVILSEGLRGMPETEYRAFVRQRDEGRLISPDVPGRAAAILALRAPHEWSGQTLHYQDEKVLQLVEGLME
ncbi:MAG TPA: SDR family NAD(P)-dependent oxidoreductase [Thermoleophilia bacterium]|nr:SDR family NAD(P)-dependent oxidoreductase [Thermoleophilia bacterium]